MKDSDLDDISEGQGSIHCFLPHGGRKRTV